MNITNKHVLFVMVSIGGKSSQVLYSLIKTRWILYPQYMLFIRIIIFKQ